MKTDGIIDNGGMENGEAGRYLTRLVGAFPFSVAGREAAKVMVHCLDEFTGSDGEVGDQPFPEGVEHGGGKRPVGQNARQEFYTIVLEEGVPVRKAWADSLLEMKEELFDFDGSQRDVLEAGAENIDLMESEHGIHGRECDGPRSGTSRDRRA